MSTNLKTLIESLGEQLSAAERELERTHTRFRVKRVEVTFKGHLGASANGGDVTKNLDASSSSSPGAGGELSSVVVELTGAPAESSGGRSVINVVGYTQAAARRKLESAGFGVMVHHQIVAPAQNQNGGPSDVGRVVTQVPSAGARVPDGTVVAVYVGLASTLVKGS